MPITVTLRCRAFIFRLVALFVLGAACGSSAELRVMSFNIRYANKIDGVNGWEQRADFVFETIEKFKPDLIGFQEVVASQYDAVLARMGDYEFRGVAREDGKRRGEWALIGFRKDRFTVLGDGNFWLSEEPEVVGSKSWDAMHPRICSWARLRELKTQRELLFANTHFDHKGNIARREASKLISRRLSAIAAGLPAILTGDFNITETNSAYAALVRPEEPGAIRWIDAYRAVHPQRSPDELSAHGFKGGTTGPRIDFIFHSAAFQATASEIDRTSRDGRFASDHYAVTAVLEWR